MIFKLSFGDGIAAMKRLLILLQCDLSIDKYQITSGFCIAYICFPVPTSWPSESIDSKIFCYFCQGGGHLPYVHDVMTPKG